VHRVNTLLSVEKSQRRDSTRSAQVTYLSPKLRREVQSVHQGLSSLSEKAQEG
jgi:hypothetical protein